jgi:hypothetical protein
VESIESLIGGFPRSIRLLNFEFGSRLRRIELRYFDRMHSSSVFFPPSLECIDDLDACRSAPRISLFVEAGNRHFMMVDGTLMNFAGTTALRYFGDDSHAVLDSKVEELACYSFMNRSMSTFTCAEPSRLRVIRDSAFWCCLSLAAVMIPSTVEEIGKRAFARCRSLREVVFAMHSQLRVIESLAFLECPCLQPVDVPYDAMICGEYRRLAEVRGADGAKRQRVEFLDRHKQAWSNPP